MVNPDLIAHFKAQGLPTRFFALIPLEFPSMAAMQGAPEPLCYVIQSGKCGPLKIGVAVNPDKRRAHLQIGNPATLAILLTLPGGYATEAKLHAICEPHAMRGEWFSPLALDAIFASVADLTEQT